MTASPQAPSVDRLIKGIEIDHNSEDALSAIVENGGISIDVGNDWSGRHHGPKASSFATSTNAGCGDDRDHPESGAGDLYQ